jgi:5-(carboxyamino)imidazole ribonucleotide mutase
MKRRITQAKPEVGVVMGSDSDWPTMQHAASVLRKSRIPHECLVVSAHRTPDWMFEYAKSAESRGLKCIIAGAGGAAHLPGMISALTCLPVLGVPIRSRALDGLDSLLSIAQMPAGIPTLCFPIGEPGAKQAGEFAARIITDLRTHSD